MQNGCESSAEKTNKDLYSSTTSSALAFKVLRLRVGRKKTKEELQMEGDLTLMGHNKGELLNHCREQLHHGLYVFSAGGWKKRNDKRSGVFRWHRWPINSFSIKRGAQKLISVMAEGHAGSHLMRSGAGFSATGSCLTVVAEEATWAEAAAEAATGGDGAAVTAVPAPGSVFTVAAEHNRSGNEKKTAIKKKQ